MGGRAQGPSTSCCGSSLHVAARWLAWATAANLVWESAQQPLYDVLPAHLGGDRVLATLHCTAGDALIAGLAYAAATITVGRARWPLAPRAWGTGLLAAVLVALAYTAISEWRNVAVLAQWRYRPVMPTLHGIGLAPLLQWIVVPLLATWAVRRRRFIRQAG